MVIENVGGAGGTLGSARVAAAAPDGYTLLAGSMGSHVAAPVLTPNLKYDLGARLRADRLHRACAGRDRRAQGFPAPRICREFIAYVKQNGDGVKQAQAASARPRTWLACCSIRGRRQADARSPIAAPARR